MVKDLSNKNSNVVASVDDGKHTIHSKGVRTDQWFIQPQTGTTAKPGSRIDFNYDFQVRPGTIVKDCYLRYKVRTLDDGNARNIKMNHPIVNLLQEVRCSLNGNSNVYLLQGDFDSLHSFYYDNLKKYNDLKDFKNARRHDAPQLAQAQGGGLATRKQTESDDPLNYWTLDNGQDTGFTHSTRLRYLLGDMLNDTCSTHLKSFNMSMLLKNAPTSHEKHWFAGTPTGFTWDNVELFDIELEIQVEHYKGALSPPKNFLVKHCREFQTVNVGTSTPSSTLILNVKNKFTPFSNVEGINFFIKPVTVSDSSASLLVNSSTTWKYFPFKIYLKKLTIKHNGVIVDQMDACQLDQRQQEEKENRGRYENSTNNSLHQQGGLYDGYVELSRVSMETDPIHCKLLNGVSNDLGNGTNTSPEVVIEIELNALPPTDGILFATCVASRSYSLGNARANFQVNSDR